MEKRTGERMHPWGLQYLMKICQRTQVHYTDRSSDLHAVADCRETTLSTRSESTSAANHFSLRATELRARLLVHTLYNNTHPEQSHCHPLCWCFPYQPTVKLATLPSLSQCKIHTWTVITTAEIHVSELTMTVQQVLSLSKSQNQVWYDSLQILWRWQRKKLRAWTVRNLDDTDTENSSKLNQL